MATLTKEQILEAVEKMTVLEISELVKAMEDKFGVSAAPIAVAGAAPAVADAAPEKDEFDVILVAAGEKKVGVIKVVKAVTDLDLMGAKKFVDAGNQVLKEKVSKDEAEDLKKKLEEAGATVKLK